MLMYSSKAPLTVDCSDNGVRNKSSEAILLKALSQVHRLRTVELRQGGFNSTLPGIPSFGAICQWNCSPLLEVLALHHTALQPNPFPQEFL